MSSLRHLFRDLRWLAMLLASGVATPTKSDDVPVAMAWVRGDATSIVVVAPATDDPALRRILDIELDYLERMSGTRPALIRTPPTSKSQLAATAERLRAGLVIVFDAAKVVEGTAGRDSPSSDGFHIDVDDYGMWTNEVGDRGATFVYLDGASVLSRQYAAYELLRRLGARFFHPEDEYIPAIPREQLRLRARTPTALARKGDGGTPSSAYAPDFRFRSYTFHSRHPLEHLEAFSDSDHPIDEAVRVNDWIVKNRGNLVRSVGRGLATAEARQRRAHEIEGHRQRVGLERTVGITLHDQQQGGRANVEGDTPEQAKLEIEAAVDAALHDAPDAVAFAIHFGPTEFTVTPDEQTLQWLSWAADRVRRKRPDLRILVNNHITGSQPTPNFSDLGCPADTHDDGRGDYYDLAFHTADDVGVNVHTVMFYPLTGPAHVYAQRSFEHKLCLMQRASDEARPLWYYPEGAWWLGFDIDVPLYLPLYLDSRRRDIDVLAPMLVRNGGSLEGHRMFDSGHEWGYWQQDYAVGLWHFNVDVSLQDVWLEILDPLCAPTAWPHGCPARTQALEIMHQVMQRQRHDFLEAKDFRGRPGGRFAYFAGESAADEAATAAGLAFRPIRVAFAEVMSMTDGQRDAFGDDVAWLEDTYAAYLEWTTQLHATRDLVPVAGRRWLDEIVDGLEIDALRAGHTARLYQAVLALRDDASCQRACRDAMVEARALLERAKQVIARREQHYRYPPEQSFGGGITPQTRRANGTTYGHRVYTVAHLASVWTNRQATVEALVRRPSSITPAPTSVDRGESLANQSRMSSANDVRITAPQHPLVGSVLVPMLPTFEWTLSPEHRLTLTSSRVLDDATTREVTTLTMQVDATGHFTTRPNTLALPLFSPGSGKRLLLLHAIDVVVQGDLDRGSLPDQIELRGSLRLDEVVAGMQELAAFDQRGAIRVLADLFAFDRAAPPTSLPIAATIRLRPRP